MTAPGLLSVATRYLFFTGKGGVGKTSLAAATALVLADRGGKVLLVSTDPASNLDEILGVELRNSPVPVPGTTGLEVLNIDPEAAAGRYRARVLAQLDPRVPEAKRAAVREQLSGACTTEIAAFDEFSALLAGGGDAYDRVIFDTAPTGHTLRLLSLPKAWTGFLAGNTGSASCLGPHSGLEMEEARFRAALDSLNDRSLTTVVLVTRPERSAVKEAARTAQELTELGLSNQRLVVNAVFAASDAHDEVARALERQGREILADLPAPLATLPRDEVPLRACELVGLPALRSLLTPGRDAPPQRVSAPPATLESFHALCVLAEDLARSERGLIMVMGKGGVGKTTLAAALAVALAGRGKDVHLSTTDPAAHVAETLAGGLLSLRVSRIDPRLETRRYVERVMATRGATLDAAERALLLEDLRSPCTEEIAVFAAFSHLVQEARRGFVVLDTAPTGHALLMMDAAGAYHRQVMRSVRRDAALRPVTPLMRLRDPAYTRIVLVTLPEATPVSQAAALQEDLRRAGIEPYAWIVNRSLLAAGTKDPLLAARLALEHAQMARIESGLARRIFVVPWLTEPPVGIAALARMTAAAPEVYPSGSGFRPRE